MGSLEPSSCRADRAPAVSNDCGFLLAEATEGRQEVEMVAPATDVGLPVFTASVLCSQVGVDAKFGSRISSLGIFVGSQYGKA